MRRRMRVISEALCCCAALQAVQRGVVLEDSLDYREPAQIFLSDAKYT